MTDRRTQRLDQIAEILVERGSLRLKDAAEVLSVSEMTVRRDISAHPERFGCFGGHIVAAPAETAERSYVLDREREAHSTGKRIACDLASGFIEPGDTLFIDCGTTTPHLARRLGDVKNITVVCYSINIAEIVRRIDTVKLIVLGGVYHPSSASFESTEALETLRRIGINKAFMSAGGFHPEHGVSCSNFHEVAIKQEAMRKAVTTSLVVDSSKYGKVRPAWFAELGAFDRIFTDPGLEPAARLALDDFGITVVTD